jgi:protein TonB
MKKEKKDKDFVKSPYFEGGRHAIDAFVKQELKYPEAALKAGVEGTVSVRYTVDYKGNVIHAQVISGIGHGCDEEAIRIVRLMKFTVPEDGRIKSKYSRKLHIHFRLHAAPAQPAPSPSPSPAPPAPAPAIQYTVSSSKPAANTPPKPATTISYTITFSPPGKKN